MSDKDLRARLPGPVTALPRRPLSIKASTASCSIRFSLRTMMSGAFSSCNLFKRLLRLITRRYKSFKSEVAKRPPSNCTIGRKSGGITGITSIIIHSGLLPLFKNASQTSKRRIRLRRLAKLFSLLTASLNSLANSSTFISLSSSLIASAPIPTRKVSPNSSSFSTYSASDRSCFFTRLVSPGSSTM